MIIFADRKGGRQLAGILVYHERGSSDSSLFRLYTGKFIHREVLGELNEFWGMLKRGCSGSGEKGEKKICRSTCKRERESRSLHSQFDSRSVGL